MGVGYGYRGILLGYVFNSNEPIHFIVSSVCGLGTSNEFLIDPDGDHGNTFNSPGFGIIEPNVKLEMNLSKLLLFQAGMGYRRVNANRFEHLTSRI
ncbi:hypothetical protein [Nafulsella turpanensis]|uniref:hypothetical protein n=1 Tax=Nafulsella turpanensis TaxID=1265690 RepID=UPI000347475C|nr:hypothetical protein [Nafulsella turpanensis]